MSQRIAVHIEGYQYNTTADSLYEAVSDAMTAFESDWWKGPQWTADTVFDVREIYGEHRQWTVRASDVLRWRSTLDAKASFDKLFLSMQTDNPETASETWLEVEGMIHGFEGWRATSSKCLTIEEARSERLSYVECYNPLNKYRIVRVTKTVTKEVVE